MDKKANNTGNYLAPFSTTVEEQFDISKQTYESPLKETTQKNYEFETDDYSVNSNFKEQTNYEIKQAFKPIQETQKTEQTIFQPIEIERNEKKQEEQVSLTKSRQRLHLGGRLKIIISSFIVIMLSLIVAIAWNFSLASKINSGFSEKEIKITNLKSSISRLKEEYKLLDSEENLKKLAEEAGFVEVGEGNSDTIYLDEMYKEVKVEEIPSNWFNDVCNFLQKVFD